MFFCECLNIIGHFHHLPKDLPSSNVKINPVQSLSDTSYYDLLDFFKLALGPLKIEDTKISIQHPSFMKKSIMDIKWTVTNCLNCDCNVFAVAGDEILINGKMMRDRFLLHEMQKNANYSESFKIILKPMDFLLSNKTKSLNNDVRVKELYSTLQDYISKDEANTEAEIRRLTLASVQRRQKAEKEFQLMVSLISSIELNCESSGNVRSTTNQSTNMSTENIESFSNITPPVTPESAMTIDHVPPFNKFMANNNHQHNSNREGISKHNNVILQKQTATRAIEFEDEIFELDGMKEETKYIIKNRINKCSDSESSDSEDMMVAEKRSHMRGRSGSLAIARSAPISMPQFLHHANPHLEEKQMNEQDIAGSIKILAKSIHADHSIFGELPNRHVFKYNNDF